MRFHCSICLTTTINVITKRLPDKTLLFNFYDVFLIISLSNKEFATIIQTKPSNIGMYFRNNVVVGIVVVLSLFFAWGLAKATALLLTMGNLSLESRCHRYLIANCLIEGD
jgi:hypothetical protein